MSRSFPHFNVGDRVSITLNFGRNREPQWGVIRALDKYDQGLIQWEGPLNDAPRWCHFSLLDKPA